jgi:SRSO17 transposase
METKRNFTEISREAGISHQNLQHFMSNSPWSEKEVYQQVQEEIKQIAALQIGGALLLDESADEKAADKSAGAGRQYNGRLGKVDMSQVGVFLAYANLTVPQSMWTWIEGELFLPEAWFDDEHAKLRERLDVPDDIEFKTKVEIGWELIERVTENQLPFEVVCCDCLYVCYEWLRSKIRGLNRSYMAEIPADTQVYLKKPRLGVPKSKSKRGRRPSKIKVLSSAKPVPVDSLIENKDTIWQRIRVRHTERGYLCDLFAARRVWTIYEGKAISEWLVMRQESDGKYTYALSNVPADTKLPQLAWWKCQRYFIERANQEAKSELGWDEFEAQKYLAWQHHLALTVLASWFITRTKYQWACTYGRDPVLLEALFVPILPALSVANIRSLRSEVMPLKQLSPEQAVEKVIEHLINRTRSRRSRIKNQPNIREAAEDTGYG